MSWLDTAGAAKYANRSVQTIRAALAAGELHGYQRVAPQGKWTVRPECLDAWIAGEPCQHQDRAPNLRSA